MQDANAKHSNGLIPVVHGIANSERRSLPYLPTAERPVSAHHTTPYHTLETGVDMDEWGREASERCVGRQRRGVVDIGRGHPCPRRDARRLVPPVPPRRHRPVRKRWLEGFGFRFRGHET